MKIEFTSEILNNLKLKGFRTIHINPLNQRDIYKATIELIPKKDLITGLDVISINSQEVYDYAKTINPMVSYLIESDYCL